MRTVLAVVLVLSGRCCQVSVELDGALHSVDARSNRAALDSFVNATKLLLFGAGENCGGDETCVGDLLEARAGQVRDECAAAAASYDRQKCASLFTCVAKVDAGGGADGHVAFHALASQREMQTIATRLAAKASGESVASIRARLLQEREACAARLDETRKRGGLAVCVGAPAPRIVTTFDATLKHAMIHHFFYGDADDEPIRMHAARVINASAATLVDYSGPAARIMQQPHLVPATSGIAWCPDGDLACIAEALSDVAASNRALARNAAHRDRQLAHLFVWSSPTKAAAYELKIARQFSVKPEGVIPLHVLSWTWEKSGYSLLPQFLTYYTNRVPGVRFTLVDFDLDAQPPRDGRDAWWDQHDVRVLKWIAKLPEGQSPRVGAHIRNMLWSRLQRDYGDEAEWIAVATGAQSATACGSIHHAAGRGYRRVPRRRCA